MHDTISRVREFLAENFILDEDVELREDTSFIDSQVLDSTGFLELVAFVEEQFGVEVADEELLPENFDTLSNIARYVSSKRSAIVAH